MKIIINNFNCNSSLFYKNYYKAFISKSCRRLFLICCNFLISMPTAENTYAQYPNAIEQWSEPVKIDTFSKKYTWEDCPSFTSNMDTMFMYISDGIYTSAYKNNKWQTPTRLNNNVNNNIPIRNPSLSKDGKRLYYTKYAGYGSWDIWYNVKDSVTNDWGPAINIGPDVNTASLDYYAYELSPDTLYVINDIWAEMGVCIFVKGKNNQTWKIVDSSNYQHLFGTGDIRGLSITADRRKAYFSYYNYNSEYDSLQSELYVTYWDTLNNRWGNCFKLNINSKAYKYKFNWQGGWDEWPCISPDGKTLYFSSNRDAAREDTLNPAPDIYMSKLIIDENGNLITAVNQKPADTYVPNEYLLFQNFPNPFNSETVINLIILKEKKISITLYNILGEKISDVALPKTYVPGAYQFRINAKDLNLSSGVYFYRLFSCTDTVTKKIIYLQ